MALQCKQIELHDYIPKYKIRFHINNTSQLNTPCICAHVTLMGLDENGMTPLVNAMHGVPSTRRNFHPSTSVRK